LHRLLLEELSLKIQYSYPLIVRKNLKDANPISFSLFENDSYSKDDKIFFGVGKLSKLLM